MRKVAVVATAFRMPGTSPARFWDDLLAGRDLVTRIDPTRWADTAYLHPNKTHPGTTYTFAAGSIGDVAGFDAGFFGISPREASLMDPQQRVLMEMSWEVFENAGIRPSAMRGSDCGVYIGVSTVDYSWRVADDLAAIDASFATGNTSSIAANRLSYAYDLRGPSMAIDTACSSSLVAFHQACRAIVAGEIGQALAGAISLHLHPLGFVSFSKASMLSRTGRCRVFDAAADGYVRSEGGGIFLLKDLEQAIADGNPILAVVPHTAVNTDGRKSGLTVPSSAAQASLLASAYRQAGIEPREIDYVEAHGTGTPVGDPIEARALGEALGRHRPKDQPLPIGSVKGNVGHLEAASGIAGLLKALHILRHRVVPPHVGMDTPNPHIPFEELNLEVSTAKRPLRSSGRLVVGVNSFGFGGANAHVILESYSGEMTAIPALPKASALPILVSARDASTLAAAARDLASHIAGQPQSALYDIAYQSVFGRERHAHAMVLFGSTPAKVAAMLEEFSSSPTSAAVECGTMLQAPRGAAFIYSGNGSQWEGMGAQLLADPTFRAAVREVDKLFSRYADYSLEAELAGKNGEGRYGSTEIAQPALFALQVGITAMLHRRGLVPVAVAGHSVGEVAAAWASGSLSLAAAVSVIHHRSVLQGTTRGSGGMTAVSLSEQQVRELLADLALANRLSVAGINSSRGVTIAGAVPDLERLETALTARAVSFKRLALDYAFHSAAMDCLYTDLRRALAHLEPGDTAIPFHSTVTGGLLAGKALNAEYWWRNIRDPVRFESAIKGMVGEGINIYVEIGPHPALRRYVQDCLDGAGATGRVIGTGGRNDDSPRRIYSGGNQALIAGATVEWQRLLPWPGRHVRLPNYPWQREPYWHPVTSASQGLLERKREHPLLGYTLRQSELVWENTLDTVEVPLLADHVIGGATVFPGTGYVELALAIACRWQQAAAMEIEDLEIRAPLLLAGEPSRTLRCALDARDGQFSIKSREQLGQEGWTLHATGRVLLEPSDIRLRRSPLELPTRPADFTARSHAELTRAAGLDYGPRFQALSHGWIDGTSVLAALQVPDSLRSDFDPYHLHPALIDCAFQLIIEMLGDSALSYTGLTFVPVRVGHLNCRSGNPEPRYARARLLSRGPHSIAAEFEIFDQALQPIARLEQVRFHGMRLPRHAREHLRYLHYAAVARPLPAAARAPYAPRAGVEGFAGALEQCFSDPDVLRARRQYAAEVEPLLDELCNRFALEALSAAPAVTPEARAYHSHLLALARADGLLDGAPPPLGSAQDIWNSLIGDYPDYFSIVHAVGSIGMHLQELLSGQRKPSVQQSALPSLPMLLRQAHGADLQTRLDGVVREQIRALSTELKDGRRLGVVEISAGTPLLGPAICQSMDADRADYRFVSSDPANVDEARRLQERYPGIEVVALDAEPKSESCHLAILWIDFRSMREALVALDYARSQLVEGGVLLVIGQHPSRWIDFVFGVDPAWWNDSPDGAPASCRADVWRARTQAAGFSQLQLHEHDGELPIGSYLLLGRRDAARTNLAESSTPRHWLLLADAEGYSAELALRLSECLRARGDSASSAVGDGPLHGIVYLSGLRKAPSEAGAASFLELQVTRCAKAAALAQLCRTTDLKTLCFVTAGAAAHLLPRRPLDAPSAALADAPLSGLARVLMNETLNCAVRLIDLDHAAAIDTAATVLADELAADDGEQEVILTSAGERYAPRLRLAPAPESDQAPVMAGTQRLRLGVSAPGQLRNLRWESQPCAPLAESQVEVAVKATGLNFRDIMYALGLLSDEAVENGFAGSSLGLEFSGVVLQVGSRIIDFAPGDAVVGFAPSSFGDRVITLAGALSPVPPGLSFEASATIPSTFLTAYYALHHLAHLEKGEKVLIHGAAGGVGIAAIQVAKWCGAEIYATAGSEEKRDFLQLLGVDHLFNSRSLSFADEILERTNGAGVDVVLNSLAGEAINRNLRVLKPFGRFLELGKRDFYDNTRVGLRPFRNNLSYFGIDADQLMSERPDLTQRLFTEVLALFRAGVFRPLPYRAFDAAEVVDAFRHMQQARHIGKVVVTYRHGLPAAQPPARPAVRRMEIAAQATILITGGLSGFGLRTAEWLAERGARHLVLISRTGRPADEAQTIVARLERRGVRVLMRACDVTDRAALGRLLEEIGSTLPPLRGIVHAAMVIDDGLVKDMNAERIRRVLAPKILGAMHLDELTRDHALDFFLLYSSATTLFGNPGQGNYVAANSALEALARARRRAGLPATCVLWGAIDDVGYLARNPKIKEALQDRMGGSALASAAALEALEAMLSADRSDLGVLELDWGALARFLPSAASPKFSELARAGGDADAKDEATKDLRQLLTELPAEEFLHTVVELLKAEIAEILRMPADKVNETLPLQQMGLDSLMAVELVVAVEQRFGTRLPVLFSTDSPTPAKLAAWIVAELRGDKAANDGSIRDETRAQIEKVASQHAAEVGAAELEQIAGQLRSGSDAKRRMIH